jgi:iron(III) transport system substrate-binding protein
MTKNIAILLICASVIALPFLFQQAPQVSDWQPGDPELVIITPNNEAIRYEFGLAFSRWHQQHFGKPVKIDWRALGGTTEIMRYLEGSFLAAYRAYWQGSGKEWPAEASQRLMNSRFKPNGGSVDIIYQTFRSVDDPIKYSAGIDLFFGGGEYDHRAAFERGMTVAPWSEGQEPPGLFEQNGIEMIPKQLSGETWRTPTLFGVAVSTFGICYNKDRLQELGVDAPTRWDDLANPKLIGQVGVADPTKSGSIAKAYEMIIQQKIQQAVLAAGFSNDDINRYEGEIENAHNNPNPWEMPTNVPNRYQRAIEGGWLQGLQLIMRIGGNARYFTDSAAKIPLDVSKGDAAMGLAIDFYGRFQAEYSRAPDGSERMVFITPEGGSSISSDPVSLLRGAPNKALAIRFMQFAMSEDGQKLWNYRPGTVGGTSKYALRRLPIRRSFYPSDQQQTTEALNKLTPSMARQAFMPLRVHHERNQSFTVRPEPVEGLNQRFINLEFAKHKPNLTDYLGDPAINPYEVGKTFTYRKRWTGHHFNIHRNLIKAMCLDAGEELKAAWAAIQQHGGTEKNHNAMQMFGTMPDGFTWRSAIEGYNKAFQPEYMEHWVKHFRYTYGKAKSLAEKGAL